MVAVPLRPSPAPSGLADGAEQILDEIQKWLHPDLRQDHAVVVHTIWSLHLDARVLHAAHLSNQHVAKRVGEEVEHINSRTISIF